LITAMIFKREYFNSVKSSLKINRAIADDIIRELRSHVDDKVRDLEKQCCSEPEALETALKSLGPPHHLAKQIYEVYSQGSWKEALFAALPHFFVAIIFAVQLWERPFWIPALFVLIGGIALYGWFHNQPTWFFPWLGYCLLPVIVAGVLLTYLPGYWVWLSLSPYVILSLLLIGYIGKQTIMKDWMLLSLTMIPVPIIIAWLLSIYFQTGTLSVIIIIKTAPLISLTFVVLSLAVLLFIRIKQRWVKMAVLIVPEVILLAFVVLQSEGSMNFLIWLILVVLSVIILFTPAMIDRRSH